MVNLYTIPKQYRSKIRQIVDDFVKDRGLNPRSIINITFVSKNKIRILNKKYRQIDQVTDVLSFPIWHNLGEIPKTGQVALGDIFVCPREADINKNLDDLIKHSLNHLVGKHH